MSKRGKPPTSGGLRHALYACLIEMAIPSENKVLKVSSVQPMTAATGRTMGTANQIVMANAMLMNVATAWGRVIEY